jgi:hypothetical protein
MMKAVKDRMLAEMDLVKTELAFRQAHIQLMTLVEDPRTLTPICHGNP